MDERMRELEQRFIAASQRTSAISKSMNERIEAQREKNAKQNAALAEAAREGKFGKDRQKVQERIDAGQTTISDVVLGLDETPEGQTVHKQTEEAGKVMGEFIKQIFEEEEDSQETRRPLRTLLDQIGGQQRRRPR